MVSKTEYDVVIIGGGHNGLTCANYLALAGLKVKVVERRGIVGGAAVTEEFHPGFRNSTLSYVVSMLEPKIIRDLELSKHGFEIVKRDVGFFLPETDGSKGFMMPRDPEKIPAAIKDHSPEDVEAFGEFDDKLKECVKIIKSTVLKTPPKINGGVKDLFSALGLANQLRKMSMEDQQVLINLFTQSAGDFLDSRFSSDRIKGLLGFQSVTGAFTSPYAPGSAYVFLHHAWGETGGKTGKWDHVRGGMGAITQAMARSAEAKGVEIQVSAPVRELLIEKGEAKGVVLEDGSIIRAKAVASNLNPKLLWTRIIDESLQPKLFAERMKAWKTVSGTFRINVALSELPDFTSRPGKEVQMHHTGSVFISPSLKYLEQAYFDARTNGWTRNPAINMCIPSTVDDSLAPKGQHVASLFCQHFAYDLPDGKSWDDEREKAADAIIDTMTRYAPNFKNAVIARKVISPEDLESEYGLTGGSIMHGNLTLDQIFSLRPSPEYADYRTPIEKLYQCGSGTHPGGGVTGAPGHNAAMEIVRDFKRRKL